MEKLSSEVGMRNEDISEMLGLTIEEVKELNSLDWTGGIYWKTNNIYYYYNKFLNKKTKLVTEELLVTKERFGESFN